MAIKLKRIERKQSEFFDISEGARYLGISYRTFKKALESGEIPFRKLGNRYIIAKRALDDWVYGENTDE